MIGSLEVPRQQIMFVLCSQCASDGLVRRRRQVAVRIGCYRDGR